MQKAAKEKLVLIEERCTNSPSVVLHLICTIDREREQANKTEANSEACVMMSISCASINSLNVLLRRVL